LGHQTVRFTGTEVVRNPAESVTEVLRLAGVSAPKSGGG
jgi:hypothetical protein